MVRMVYRVHYAVLSSMCIAILFMFVGKNQVPIMECLQFYVMCLWMRVIVEYIIIQKCIRKT